MRFSLLGPLVVADVADEPCEAFPNSGRLQLVAEHGRERERERGAGVEQLEQWQVGAGDGLPEPLLAEGPGAEALDVGHVGVENDR